MTNFEFYKDEILKACDNGRLYTFISDKTGIDLYLSYSESNMIRWLYKEHEILDEQENKYLSAVIKPFRNDIKAIIKCNTYKHEYIEIRIKKTDYRFNFPLFKKGTMYKGMKADTPYTLQELGL